jgi:hypothetical protein
VTGLTVTDEMLKAYWRATQAADLDTMADAHRAGLQAVLDLIASTDPEPVEGPPGTVPVTLWLTAQEVSGEGEGWDSAVDKLCDACAAIDLPAPKPPWKSPLDDLPDLTEEQCVEAVKYAQTCGVLVDGGVLGHVGRALKAAGWTPKEEA